MSRDEFARRVSAISDETRHERLIRGKIAMGVSRVLLDIRQIREAIREILNDDQREAANGGDTK